MSINDDPRAIDGGTERDVGAAGVVPGVFEIDDGMPVWRCKEVMVNWLLKPLLLPLSPARTVKPLTPLEVVTAPIVSKSVIPA